MSAPQREVIGDCELFCGDCRDVLPMLPDASFEMIFTDPPYGHNNNNGDLIHRWEAALNRKAKNTEARPIAGDGKKATELVSFLFEQAARLLQPDSSCCCCCCGGGGGPDPQFARWSLMMDGVLTFDQMVVWDKGPIGMGWRYRRSYETVLIAHRKGGKLRWFDDTGRVENIIRAGTFGIKKLIPGADDHPTPKPIQLGARFIQLHTQPGEIVLDPFMGAGTTGVACVNLVRRFIGVEIEPRYFDIACKRIEDAYRQGDLFGPPPAKPVQEVLAR